jgi:hypothetical protein
VPPQIASSFRREEGTASVELIAAIPFLLLAILVAAQVGVAGEALWSAGIAARAGARAAVVGGDAKAAARQALPASMRSEAAVGVGEAVSVRVRIPHLLPGLPPLSVSAKSGLGNE